MRTGVNSYFAILVVVIAGAVATTLIVHTAYTTVFPIVGGSAAYYDALQ